MTNSAAQKQDVADGSGLQPASIFGRPYQSLARLSGTTWVILLALAKVALLLLPAAEGYGYFRDELYYLDAASHPAWGYVDFPPLAVWIAAGVRAVSGVSPLGLRLLPAVAGALVIVLAGLMAREVGAGRIGQALAALACLAAPMLLAIDSFFSVNPFDQLWWSLLAYLVIRLLKQERAQLWLACGAVVGVGLLTKPSMLAWGLALAAGLAFSPARRQLSSRWFWAAGVLALLIGAPYLLWQIANGWPTLEFWNSYRQALVERSVPGFVVQQILGMNPMTLPLSAAGVYFYLISRRGRPYRGLGWAFVLLMAALVLANAKAYFLAPAYPMLFAGGACALEAAFARRLGRWVRPAYAGLLVAAGLFMIPITLPVLPPALVARAYAPAMTHPAIHMDSSESSMLPEWFAGRLGWEEMASAVAGIYARLPAGQQAAACILAGSYGEAGALNLYRAAYGLPPVIGRHNNYFLWGPGECTGEVIIAVGIERVRLETAFGRVAEARRLKCPECIAGETDVAIYVCSEPREPLPELWSAFKRYSM